MGWNYLTIIFNQFNKKNFLYTVIFVRDTRTLILITIITRKYLKQIFKYYILIINQFFISIFGKSIPAWFCSVPNFFAWFLAQDLFFLAGDLNIIECLADVAMSEL